MLQMRDNIINKIINLFLILVSFLFLFYIPILTFNNYINYFKLISIITIQFNE